MASKCVIYTLLVAVVGLVSQSHMADAHGYLVQPRSRNVVAFGVNRYEPSTGNGIGPAMTLPIGNPGPCGDPFQQQSPASNFAGNPTPIQATYTQGQNIGITVALNVNHGGRFTFKLCPRNTNLDQACFDQHRLVRADTGSLYYYLLTGSWNAQSATNPQILTMTYKLPAGVSCDGGCVLQWDYKTYNSCVDPCPSSECGFYASRSNQITGQTGPLAYCPASTVGAAEVFKNCADIRIIPGGPTPPGPTPPGPTPPGPTPPGPTPPAPPPPGTCPTPSQVCAANPGKSYVANPYSCDSTCNSFIQCANGIGYLQRCGTGLRWNSRAMVCDWSYNVGCPN